GGGEWRGGFHGQLRQQPVDHPSLGRLREAGGDRFAQHRADALDAGQVVPRGASARGQGRVGVPDGGAGGGDGGAAALGRGGGALGGGGLIGGAVAGGGGGGGVQRGQQR